MHIYLHTYHTERNVYCGIQKSSFHSWLYYIQDRQIAMRVVQTTLITRKCLETLNGACTIHLPNCFNVLSCICITMDVVGHGAARKTLRCEIGQNHFKVEWTGGNDPPPLSFCVWPHHKRSLASRQTPARRLPALRLYLCHQHANRGCHFGTSVRSF